MLITLSRRALICQSVVEVQLTGVAPLGAVSHRLLLLLLLLLSLFWKITFMYSLFLCVKLSAPPLSIFNEIPHCEAFFEILFLLDFLSF